MYPGQGSLRGRLLFVSAILLTTLFTAAFYLRLSADATFEQNRHITEHQRQLTQVLTSLQAALYDAEGGLYEYAVLMDDAQRVRINTAQGRARKDLERLRKFAAEQHDPRIRELVQELGEALATLDQDAGKLLQLLGRSESRYPVSVLLTRHMGPTDVRFVEAVSRAIANAEILDDRALREQALKQLGEIRYHWSQQVSVVRLYVANRSGLFGPPATKMLRQMDDRLAYLRGVDDGIERLSRLRERGTPGALFAQEAAEMRAARRDHDLLFAEAVGLYESNAWRADVPFFADRIKPDFAVVRGAVRDMEERLAALATASFDESLDTAGNLSLFLWLVTVLAAGFVVSTYLAYEKLVREPVGQVTDALRALEQGTSYSPVLRTSVRETDALLQAFSDMQRQVHAREMRLASILNNAGEGIVTVNERGIVETFNNAAERIFGYDESEVIGRNVTMLMPPEQREAHEGHLSRHLEAEDADILGREINVHAQRKDGSLFPMAIKVTELILDGRHYYTAIVEDISERKALMDHLRQLAEHDSLTGLYNRSYFLAELERVVERSLRLGGMNCALLYIDLDNFKFVNDTLGHQAGDRVLVEVAVILGKRSRRGDVIARLGGDEFAVLLFDVDATQSCAVAEDYRQLLVEYSFRHEGRVIDVGCSIGVAMLGPEVGSKEELMSRADISCHMAKRAGRNSVHLYRPDDRKNREDMTTDMSLARTIKHAIEKDRFDFALQPIVEVQTGRVAKYEALLRMLDADGKPIMPSAFIRSAERFGLILDIDRWVIEHAVDLMRRRNQPHEHLAINLSAKSIGDPGLLVHTTRVLEESGISPTRLTFEITETVAIADLSAAIALLQQLRDLGCRTALDDFGAGYSSFAYLKDLPVDCVKIDGSFVLNIHEDALHLAMVKSMNEIAHAMGKKTVAEFVANGRILSKLQEIGVDYAQGFHTGKPELAGYPEMTALPDSHRARA